MSTLDPDSEERPLLTRRTLGLDDHRIEAANEADESEAGVELQGESRAQIERSLLRKLDRRMSILILIYILNYIDRNNASAARLRGFEEDLHLEGNQFATILSVLYVGYIFMQIPSNMLLVYIGKPSVYLPVCMVIWGCISILTGVTTNFLGALCTRFFLGFVEAAFFPGALVSIIRLFDPVRTKLYKFLLSKWYKRDELSQRTALLYCGNLISNAFGALIASGILDTMDGVLGFTAWRWLTPAERALAMHRMTEDAAGIADASTNQSVGTIAEDALEVAKQTNETEKGLRLALADLKVWWLAMSIGVMTVSLSFNAFFPTLGATLGYNTTTTLLLCAPPWIFSTIVTIMVAR
ncbi:hypothetical protein C0991_006071 [Blastosporella zonata]|nr:hypothetical protein C0991_006071 [Blastosporella zonata]